jgi:hypothetical protein
MFENIELRKVANGFIMVLNTDDGDTREYVYDTARKLMRAVKQHLDANDKAED